MSRWRESLCGKLITANHENSKEVQSWAASHQSEVLSCGGKFVSRPPESLPLRAKPGLPSAIILPKLTYEIIMHDPQEGFLRYGPEPTEEFAELELLDPYADDVAKVK